EYEMAIRRTMEADQGRSADEFRRGRDHLAHSQRVGKIGSAEISYWPAVITTWSDTLYDLFGVEKRMVAPTREDFLTFVHPDDHAVVRGYREREARGDYPRASEFRIIRRDGQHRWIRRQAEPTEWHDGVPARAIATYQDVTEQKD